MRDAVLSWVHGLPAPLAVLVVSMLPIFELRGGIPLGFAMGMRHWPMIYAAAVVGNFVPVIPILLLLGPIERGLRRFAVWDRFFTWLFARTMKRSQVIQRYESIGLTLFVAIPAPMTGAWTGAVAAYLLKLPLRYAIPCIILGILLAGAVVTLAALGVIALGN